MKRTVDAWAYRWEATGYLCCADIEAKERLLRKHGDGVRLKVGRIIPCTITYDDGSKPKRRKRPHA